VLHLADYGGAYSGNFIASLLSLVEPSRALGLRVVFGFSDIAKGQPFLDDLRAQGLSVHLLPKTAPLRDRTSEVARLAEAENASLIHTHFYRWDVPASLAAATCNRPPPVVWHLHSPLGNRSVAGHAKEALKLRLLGRRARVAAVSEAILSEVVDSGFPADRASYIPNGIDLTRATTRCTGRDEVRRELAIPAAAQTVLAFGWDPLRKGMDLALDAFVSIAARGGVELVLVVVGTDELETLLRKRFGGALPSWLRFLRPREHVGDLYAAADVFLSASRVEGFPYALGEALANGLPVVVSDIPGCEWARDIDGTRFFPSGAAAALEEAIRDVAGWTPDRRAAFGRAGRALAKDRLSLEAWAGRVARLYERTLAEG
jgi:glycosyltransferase involved in cell wall biosynthesis